MNKKRNISSQELKNAIMDVLKEEVDRNNYGMLATKRASLSSYKTLYSANVCFENDIVMQNGVPIMKIERRFSNSKARRFYSELVPKLVRIESDDADRLTGLEQ